MKIYNNICELVGGTPLMRLENFEKLVGAKAHILAKLEYFNPAGSAKDRIAKFMIADAEKRGLLKDGTVIIEPTSGNTGIGLAAIAAAKGYKVILTMPETMSAERRASLKAYGAEIVLTDGKKGMRGAIEKAEELKAEYGNAFIAGQFVNPSNPRAHYETTGPEIWNDTDGAVAALVAGVGTGGTVSGAGKFLKEKDARVRIFAVEPSSSPVLSCGKAGAHGIQGIGAGFVPETLDRSVVDEVLTVSDEQAMEAAKKIAKSEGVFVGISSGAAAHAAATVSLRDEFKGKNIVVVLPDTGARYLSVKGFID